MRMPSGTVAPTALARPPAGGGARGRGAGLVDLLGLIRQAVAAELQRRGAERIGLENLGAGAYVFGVDLLHQAGLLEVQFVVADVQEEALAVQHRPHRPVEDVDAAILQQGSQGDSHRPNNNSPRTYS